MNFFIGAAYCSSVVALPNWTPRYLTDFTTSNPSILEGIIPRFHSPCITTLLFPTFISWPEYSAYLVITSFSLRDCLQTVSISPGIHSSVSSAYSSATISGNSLFNNMHNITVTMT
mmetsp:Transcript_126660/g.219461  ORF Transcript_126660/g.219461 Transcript_126660/m.219461 type:complete len:116 (+) Transcript_126660:304-651(+)